MSDDLGAVVITRPLPFLEPSRISDTGRTVRILDQPEGPTPATLRESARDAAALVVNGDVIDAQFFEAVPTLQVVAQYGIGVDNIDLAAAEAAGVTVVNLPDAVTESTVELTIGLLLACARRIVEADRLVRQFRRFPPGADSLMSEGLHDRRLGIIGPGRIGRRVATVARALGMRVHYWGRTSRPDMETALGATRHSNITTLCHHVDALSIHVPSTPETLHLLGEQQLAALPAGAIVVNTARGSVVDEEALARALAAEHLGSVGLDVFEGEPDIRPALLDHPHTVLTPHVGTSTVNARKRMSRIILEEVAAVLTGQEPRYPVRPQA